MPGAESIEVRTGDYAIPRSARWEKLRLTYAFAADFPREMQELVRLVSPLVGEECRLRLKEGRGGRYDILWTEGDPGKDNEGRCRVVRGRPVITMRPAMIDRRGWEKALAVTLHELGHATGLPHPPREGLDSIMYHLVPLRDRYGEADCLALRAAYGDA